MPSQSRITMSKGFNVLSGTKHRPSRTGPKSIYWANELFCEADRAFNTRCAQRLREAGYDFFVPQKSPVKKDASPSTTEIFRMDTASILNSRLVVACLDQE